MELVRLLVRAVASQWIWNNSPTSKRLKTEHGYSQAINLHDSSIKLDPLLPLGLNSVFHQAAVASLDSFGLATLEFQVNQVG